MPNQEAQAALKAVMQEFANEGDKSIEAFNTKGLALACMYEMLVALAVLHHNEGSAIHVFLGGHHCPNRAPRKSKNS